MGIKIHLCGVDVIASIVSIRNHALYDGSTQQARNQLGTLRGGEEFYERGPKFFKLFPIFLKQWFLTRVRQ